MSWPQPMRKTHPLGPYYILKETEHVKWLEGNITSKLCSLHKWVRFDIIYPSPYDKENWWERLSKWRVMRIWVSYIFSIQNVRVLASYFLTPSICCLRNRLGAPQLWQGLLWVSQAWQMKVSISPCICRSWVQMLGTNLVGKAQSDGIGSCH